MSGGRCQGVVSLALVVSLVLVGMYGQATGQARRLELARVYGRVQWVAAEKMLVATDCPILEACTPVVDVDLRRVPLSDYRGLRTGSWVLVDGIVSHDNGHQRLFATSIMLVEEWQSP